MNSERSQASTVDYGIAWIKHRSIRPTWTSHSC